VDPHSFAGLRALLSWLGSIVSNHPNKVIVAVLIPLSILVFALILRTIEPPVSLLSGEGLGYLLDTWVETIVPSLILDNLTVIER